MSRLDGLEVYARPKADLVKEAAAAAEAETAEAGGGDFDGNLGLAAICLPGHLVAQTPGLSSVHVLSQGLLTLTSLHQCLTGISFMCTQLCCLWHSVCRYINQTVLTTHRIACYIWSGSLATQTDDLTYCMD